MQQEKKLKKFANTIRKGVIEGVYNAGCGHPGGALSLSDALAVLYFEVMNVDPKNPKWEDRDRFVLSKGHSAPGLYAALAEKGFFSDEELKNLRQADSFLQGHPDMNKVPGVDMSTGSLGQGISAAVGMALIGKTENRTYRVYAALGDGELQEGQVWEAFMCAAHYKLDNLTALVDFNGLQIDGAISNVMSPLPIDDKFKAFGWNVIVVDGHDCSKILEALNTAKETKGKPTVVILKTVKGKGVSYMENKAEWHGAAPNKELYEKAIDELNATLNALEEK